MKSWLVVCSPVPPHEKSINRSFGCGCRRILKVVDDVDIKLVMFKVIIDVSPGATARESKP
jgi:hypothetical protein